MTQPVFRFAPSPNGRLHLGHAFSALLNATLAARQGGRLLLRIEDIDLARCRPEYEAGILEDLAWLGFVRDGPVRRQSEHFCDYRAAFARLRDERLVYPCFCTRTRIAAAVMAREESLGSAWPRDPDGAPLYPGCCLALTMEEREQRARAGEPHAWRLDVAAAIARLPAPLCYRAFDPSGLQRAVGAAPERWGDAIVVRKDVPTSYHLSVVVDDALQAVTHVVRGRDLEAATDLHVLLQGLLGLPAPLYHHHDLVRRDGAKLSKSLGSEALADLRRRGVTASDVRRMLGFAA